MLLFIGLSTPKKKWLPLGWLIRKANGTAYSHTYIRLFDASVGTSVIFHAAGSKVHFTNYRGFLKDAEIVEEYEIPVSFAEFTNIIAHFLETLDRPYGKKQLIGLALVKFAKLWFNKKIHNPLKDGLKSEICVEASANVLKLLGESTEENVEDKDMKWIRNEVRRVSEKRLEQNRG